jgi:hypothetical protein
MGKLGALLNKDMSALMKDAGKLLTTDVGTIGKNAKRVLKTDLSELLRDAPPKEKPATIASAAPVATMATPELAKTTQQFDPDATQKMERMPHAAAHFDPDVTQKIDRTEAAATSTMAVHASGNAKAAETAVTLAAEIAQFNLELLLRAQREVPTGNEVKVLLPFDIGEFARPHATPSGELANDAVNAVYAGRGESVQVQLALCWDADEALERVDEMLTKMGQSARTTSERNWVMGPTSQGVAIAWTRGNYYFCATSAKGVNALARFLSAYPF